ncbi:MAG: hypothetical protein ACKO37_09825 [Vampirovibrionales bacterium]
MSLRASSPFVNTRGFQTLSYMQASSTPFSRSRTAVFGAATVGVHSPSIRTPERSHPMALAPQRFGNNAPLLSLYQEAIAPVVNPLKAFVAEGFHTLTGSWGRTALQTIQSARHWYRERIPKPIHWAVTTAEALVVTHVAVIAENLYYDNILRPLIVRPSVKQVNHFMSSSFLNPATYAPTSLKARSTTSHETTPSVSDTVSEARMPSQSTPKTPVADPAAPRPNLEDTPALNPFLPRNALYLITRSLPNPWLYSGYELES